MGKTYSKEEEEGPLKLSEYFENTLGRGVLATADAEGHR